MLNSTSSRTWLLDGSGDRELLIRKERATMFTVRNSLIAAFLLLMVAQVGHACSIPSTFLDAYTDGVTVFADASISDTGANVWVRVVISKPDGQTGGSDLAGGVDYAAASASSPVNGQYGD